MLRELQIDAEARANGLVLVRTPNHAYHLWSSEHENFVLKNAVLIDCERFLFGGNAPRPKRKIRREPPVPARGDVRKARMAR